MSERRPRQVFECTRTWDQLTATRDPDVRFCGACQHEVHRAHDDAGMLQLVRAGACVLDVRRPSAAKMGMFTLDSTVHTPSVVWLVPLDGPYRRRTIVLPPGTTTTFGSAAPAQVVLPGDPTIAKVHCRITLDAAAATIIDDGGHGVMVRGAVVRRAELGDGDELVMGATRLIFKTIN